MRQHPRCAWRVCAYVCMWPDYKRMVKIETKPQLRRTSNFVGKVFTPNQNGRIHIAHLEILHDGTNLPHSQHPLKMFKCNLYFYNNRETPVQKRNYRITNSTTQKRGLRLFLVFSLDFNFRKCTINTRIKRQIERKPRRKPLAMSQVIWVLLLWLGSWIRKQSKRENIFSQCHWNGATQKKEFVCELWNVKWMWLFTFANLVSP